VKYLFLALAWTAYCVLHTALISETATGFLERRLGAFIGISQLRRRFPGGLATGGGIDSTGILGVVRHPWYTAVLLLRWARDLSVARLVVSGVLTVYVVVGMLLEERKLVHEFGNPYHAYQERVSMFVPLKWLRDRCGTIGPWPR